MDELYLGVLFCITLTVGVVARPVGSNLCTSVSTSGEPYSSVVKGVIPFMIVMMVCVTVCAYVPQIITFLPNLMLGS